MMSGDIRRPQHKRLRGLLKGRRKNDQLTTGSAEGNMPSAEPDFFGRGLRQRDGTRISPWKINLSQCA